MKIAVGCDPNAEAFKQEMIAYMKGLGHEITDFGSEDVIYAHVAIKVGEEVAAKFREAFPEDSEAVISSKGGSLYVNLWEANRRQLLQAGLRPTHIEMAETCTACEHQWYFSYRADGGRTGRMAALIALKED